MATVTKALVGSDLVSANYNFGLYVNGTDLNDTLYGTAYADEIHGRLGADVLHGGGGDDLLFGEAGNDSLFGGSGNDRLDGGSGNDLLAGGTGADALIGGSGFDTASYAASGGSVYVNLAANIGVYGDAQGDTFSDIEKVVGSSYDDGLVANDNGIVLDGGAGHDFLLGGAGWDALIGGTGNDTLQGGGRGIDVLTGGAGADHFVFDLSDGADYITDFQPGVDKIVLGDGFDNPHVGPFGIDGVLATGTELPPRYAGANNDHDSLFFDTDDHALYVISPHFEPLLLATFTNNIQLQTSDFIL